MKRENDITGIGRMYQGSEFLAEVLYKLKTGADASYFSDNIQGHIQVLEGLRAYPFSVPQTLRLEDGRMLQITIERGDTRVGKYSVHGIGYIQ